MASRSPAPGVGYDQSLLAAAPEVTKADKQEGYNPDLLEQGTPTRGATSRKTPVSLPANGNYNGSGSDESNGHRKAALPVAAPATKGRPKKLMWIIGGVVLLVIIAVAVGVGVGVGSKKNNGNNESLGPNGLIPTTTDTGKPDDTVATQTSAQNPASTGGDGGDKPTEGDGAVSPTGVNEGSNGDQTSSTGQGGTFPVSRPI